MNCYLVENHQDTGAWLPCNVVVGYDCTSIFNQLNNTGCKMSAFSTDGCQIRKKRMKKCRKGLCKDNKFAIHKWLCDGATKKTHMFLSLVGHICFFKDAYQFIAIGQPVKTAFIGDKAGFIQDFLSRFWLLAKAINFSFSCTCSMRKTINRNISGINSSLLILSSSV